MPTFFAAPEDFRAWLHEHHQSARELLVGFYRKGCGRPSITWPESVDEALCVGWIDGVRRTIDPESYSIRFTPRRARSTWSAVNLRRMEALIAEGRVLPAGLLAYEARAEGRSGVYSYEQRGEAAFWPDAEAAFRARPRAWDFFQAQPPGYRKTATWYVVSAKRQETRQKRLEELIEASEAGRGPRQIRQPSKR